MKISRTPSVPVSRQPSGAPEVLMPPPPSELSPAAREALVRPRGEAGATSDTGILDAVSSQLDASEFASDADGMLAGGGVDSGVIDKAQDGPLTELATQRAEVDGAAESAASRSRESEQSAVQSAREALGGPRPK